MNDKFIGHPENQAVLTTTEIVTGTSQMALRTVDNHFCKCGGPSHSCGDGIKKGVEGIMNNRLTAVKNRG